LGGLTFIFGYYIRLKLFPILQCIRFVRIAVDDQSMLRESLVTNAAPSTFRREGWEAIIRCGREYQFKHSRRYNSPNLMIDWAKFVVLLDK